MNKKLLYIVNPNAGMGDGQNNLMRIIRIFSAGGYDVTVYPTTAPRDLTRKIIADGKQYDVIVCIGGDGTLNEAVCGLMALKDPPPLGYIPAGTMNDVAASLGIPNDPIKAAQSIVEGEEFRLDIGELGDGVYFAYVAAFGLFTDVPYDTPQEDKRVLGRLAYLFEGARSLADAHPIRLTCEMNGETLQATVIDGLVSSSNSVAGFHANRNDLEILLNDGKAEVLLIRELKNVLDFNTVASNLLRRDFSADCFISRQTEQITLRFDEDVRFTVDGEYGGCYREVTVRMHREAIRILIPKA